MSQGWPGRVRAWRPSPRQLLRGLPVVVVVATFGVFVARNADTPEFPDYDVPEGFTPAPAPTTLPPGAVPPSLPAVDGTTTTTLPPNEGRSTIRGAVYGPGGPVVGATVRIERAIGDALQRRDVATFADGSFEVGGLGGGRYRVRAFLPPTLAQPSAEVFFLRDGDTRSLDLLVDGFGEPSVTVAIAPDPPLVDQPLNLAIRVTGRVVDADGFVRSQPLVGGFVDVFVDGDWVRLTPLITGVTDAAGEVRLEYLCRGFGATEVQIAVRPTFDATPRYSSHEAPRCIDPSSLTTTTTTTLAPDDEQEEGREVEE